MSTITRSDTDLLASAAGGDVDALYALVEPHLHPAWRIAIVTAGDRERAESATVDGIVAGLLAAARLTDTSLLPLRVRLVASVRQAANAMASSSVAPSTSDDPVVAAFLALPEKSRTALWLTEVEGGMPEQVAPVLGLDRSAAAALADRAALALRERLAADVAARSEGADCRNALAKLPAHAAGKLTAAERAKVGDHVGGCGHCAVWLAALVSPRPALRRLVGEPPTTLAAEIEARWLEHLKRERAGWMAPFTERAIGAAAAAVLAIGLGGVAFLGDRADDDTQDRRSEIAVPASVDPGVDGADGGAADEVATPPPAPVAPPTTTPASTRAATPSDDVTAASDAPPQAATPTPTTTSPTTPATTPPVDDDDAPPQPPPPPDDDTALQVDVQALQGAVSLAIGECTGLAILEIHVGCVLPPSDAPLSITVDLPGLDPIGI